MTRAQGFTVVELLVAMAIMLAVMASIFGLIDPARGIFAAQSEAADMQQRLRVAIDMLGKDLLMAGAGMYAGPIGGPLVGVIGPVLPFRAGAMGADAPEAAYSDRFSVIYVPHTAAQARIADPVTSTLSTVNVAPAPGCPPADAACGFERGMFVILMDPAGGWDTFTVLDVQGTALQLQHRGAQLGAAYPAGSPIAQVLTYTYWLKTDVAADSYQLMRYDGNVADVPVADNVVGLAVAYFGEPVVAATGADLIRLSSEELSDGPWRPDAASPGRYDTDLRRIRRISVTLRVQAPAAFRAPAGAWFRRGGNSRRSEHYLPDREIRIDVAPRNMNP